MLDVDKKLALITGASSGIGEEFALQLARDGYDLILVARNQEKLESLKRELERLYLVKIENIVADLSKVEEIKLVENFLIGLDKIDLLINGAGFGLPGKFVETDIEKQIEMINVHVISSVRLTRAVLPKMISQKSGAVINIASLSAFLPLGPTYSATKAYLVIFSQSLQDELEGVGIKIQALCPGFTYTGFHDRDGFQNFNRSSIPGFLWMRKEQVVKESLEMLKKNKVICIPGIINKIIVKIMKTGLVPTAKLINRV